MSDAISSNLVAFLRATFPRDPEFGPLTTSIREKVNEAADEIERLQRECQRLLARGDKAELELKSLKEHLARRAADETPARTDSERLQWLANTLLCSDYGDNAHPGKLIGWRVMEFIAPVIYGRSLEEAIDAGMDDELNRRRKRQMKPTVEGLEKLLQAEDSTPVQILPDGSVRPMPAEETSASIPAKYGHFWYVEELTAGRWHRSAQGHSWALEADARDQCEELRRRYSDRVYRVTESESGGT